MTIYEQLQEADKAQKSNEPLDLMELFRLFYELKRVRESEEAIAGKESYVFTG